MHRTYRPGINFVGTYELCNNNSDIQRNVINSTLYGNSKSTYLTCACKGLREGTK